jgi:hypothetical protein
MAIKQLYREKILSFWLFISAFGIMFAVLSWMQEAAIIPPVDELGAWKGIAAVITGSILYFLVAREIPGGPGDE